MAKLIKHTLMCAGEQATSQKNSLWSKAIFYWIPRICYYTHTKPTSKGNIWLCPELK
ncbi:hypothetical protein TOT_040000019 [Theileria orientalis strain Shintoku]|uniref:Uncharacterized protein n=1 Tax=Theileria orientalis strain Shintoku TaxID=869250 RepID=J4C8Z3_THEOR|nr:hypothetical protein TOT_040000019 [Theileria orientalis strain Shintoku]BAM41638.1 hypothetical protein TOT_040000019 [Theileria orientalis strain Shintoku]|eukprot:XP_009691939.1 hypothetical protein TOT_040000019 [Theileria orientalis strain Shintoku]